MAEKEQNMQMARLLAQSISEEGGRAFLVGGYVRDSLMGSSNKDLDIEVHGVTPARLEELLDNLGSRLTAGVSFGIYGLKGYDLDIAMPRMEHATGRGHRDFTVFVDPFIGPEKACQRRDFTVNAMLMDVLTGEILDPCCGQEDLQKGILRHVNDKSFAEDPLRVLRGAGFAARFGFTVAEETVELCRTMDLSALSRERVMGELTKALLKAPRPSEFFRVLRRMNQLETWFPEVSALIGVPQNPRYHSEGDVWEHTLMVIDQAATMREKVDNPLALMLAAVTHDFGKALCTEKIGGVFHAYAHEKKGLVPARVFLSRLTREQKLTRLVLNLTEYHMKPNGEAAAGVSVKTTNRLFDSALDPEALLALAKADNLGRITAEELPDYEDFLRERLDIYREMMSRPHVTGADLVKAGLKPGPAFSQCLDYAHKLRLAGVEKPLALKQTLAQYRKQEQENAAPEGAGLE